MRSLILALLLAAAILQIPPAFAGTWQERGPALGGRLSAIVASPTDPNTLIVASPGGGIWRTIDNGKSWTTPQGYGLGDFTVVALEWDRVHAGRLYASTYSDLLASSDLGDHWQNLTSLGAMPAPLMPPWSFVADPRPFAQLVSSSNAGVTFWAKPCSGIFYSLDGTTFTQLWPFPGGSTNPDNCISAIAADEVTGHVYIVTLANTHAPPGIPHVFKSECAWTGATLCTKFVAASSGLPVPGRVDAITWTGTGDQLVAHVFSAGTNSIYATRDGGTTWGVLPGQVAGPYWGVRALVSPTPGQVLMGAVQPYMTQDLGATAWSVLPLPSATHPDFRAFYWGDGYLWGVTDGAMYGAYANIVRWSFTPGSAPTAPVSIPVNGVKAWQAYYAGVTAQSGSPLRRMFVGTMDNGGMCSDDAGETWSPNGAPPGGGCADLIALAIAPSNPDRAYSLSCDPNTLYRTDSALSAPTCADLASKWTAVSPPGGVNPSTIHWSRAMLAVHPTQPETVALARHLDVGVSVDGGASLVGRSLPGGARPVSVFFDPAGDLYAGTLEHGIFKSSDAGATWSAFGLNSPAPTLVTNLAWSSAGGGTYFASTTDGLFRLLPGSTWTLVTAGKGYAVSDVEVDAHCPTLIYAALGFVGRLGQHRGGVRVSTDGGSTWTSITSGLPVHQAPIADIQSDPMDSRYLYAGVYGRGVWIYDWGAAPACP